MGYWLLVVVTLGGCASSPATGEASGTTAPTTTGPTTTGPTTTGPTTAGPTALVLTADDQWVVSTDRTVVCRLTTAQVECAVPRRAWQWPQHAPTCFLPESQALVVDQTLPGRVGCLGSRPGNGSELAPGQSARRGAFTCTGQAHGLECRNTRSGHGLTAGSAEYHLR